MVILKVIPKKGHVRICNSRCYTAKRPKCTCICGRRNHGVGQKQAIHNTLGITALILMADNLDPLLPEPVTIHKPQLQEELFEK